MMYATVHLLVVGLIYWNERKVGICKTTTKQDNGQLAPCGAIHNSITSTET